MQYYYNTAVDDIMLNSTEESILGPIPNGPGVGDGEFLLPGNTLQAP